MKLIINAEDFSLADYVTGFVISLKDFSVGEKKYYTIHDIKNIINKYPTKEIFINLNKNIFNADLGKLKKILLELAQLKITGIFFYDLAILELNNKLALNLPLVWNQTHMVTNYQTCNYYYNLGVKYAYLAKEITLDEILAIKDNSPILTLVEVLSRPLVAYSKRKLLTNYYDSLAERPKKELSIMETISKEEYNLSEDKSGTAFRLNQILNGTGVIKELFKHNISYIIMRDDDIPFFNDIVISTSNYLKNNCTDSNYVEKWKNIGDTGFFYKKTIYRVKKDD